MPLCPLKLFAIAKQRTFDSSHGGLGFFLGCDLPPVSERLFRFLYKVILRQNLKNRRGHETPQHLLHDCFSLLTAVSLQEAEASLELSSHMKKAD